MDIHFDENGYLKPYKPIELKLEEFHKIFAYNLHRQRLFETYLHYLDTLRNNGIGSFTQWIDGSYVTKFAYPRDIDLVNFVNYDFHRKFEHQLKRMKNEFKERGIDGYFETDYPETHTRNFLTVFQKNKWQDIYGFDRKDDKKGFILINY